MQLYLYEIGEQFRPVEEAAIEYYARCVKTSADYKLYNQFTTKAIDALEKRRETEAPRPTAVRPGSGAFG